MKILQESGKNMLTKRKIQEWVNSRGMMGMSHSQESRAIFYCDYFGKEFGTVRTFLKISIFFLYVRTEE